MSEQFRRCHLPGCENPLTERQIKFCCRQHGTADRVRRYRLRRHSEAKAFEHGVLPAAREVLRNAEMTAEMEAAAALYYAEPAPYMIRGGLGLAEAGVSVNRNIRDCKLRDESRLLRGKRTHPILPFDKHGDRADASKQSAQHEWADYRKLVVDDSDISREQLLYEFTRELAEWQFGVRKRFYGHWPQTLRSQLTRWWRKTDARERAVRDETRRARASRHFLSRVELYDGGGKWIPGFSRAGALPDPVAGLAYAVAHVAYLMAVRQQRKEQPHAYPFPGPGIMDASQPIACCDKHEPRRADFDILHGLRATGIGKIRESNPAQYAHERVGELGAVCRHCLRLVEDCSRIVNGERELFVHDSIVRDKHGAVISMVGSNKPGVAKLVLVDDQSSTRRPMQEPKCLAQRGGPVR